MAGIAFKLQHLISTQKVSGYSQAYLSSALIATGPWILMALGISALAGGQVWIGSDQHSDFRAMVTYAFAFSQILAGALQLAISRIAADRLFEHDDQSLFPIWLSSSVLCTLLCWIAGLFWTWVWQLSLVQGMAFTVLMGLLGLLWNSSSFLSTLRDFKAILYAYGLGAVVCIIYAWCAQLWDFEVLWGLNLGLGLCLGLMLRRIALEFDLSPSHGWDILQALRSYPALIVMGLSYGLGIWIDKFLFWWMPQTQMNIAPHLFQCPQYDAPIFWALLSVIPSYALFLLHTETSFYKIYRNFYGSIEHKASFRELHSHKQKMRESVLLNARKLLLSQGTISALFLALPMVNPKWMGLSHSNMHIYQILILGTLLQVLFLFVNILLQYLDFTRLSALLCLGFALANGLFTWLSIEWGGLSWYGYGLFGAALLSLVLAWISLQKILDKLEYYTFMGPKSRL